MATIVAGGGAAFEQEPQENEQDEIFHECSIGYTPLMLYRKKKMSYRILTRN
jgi:hypothetical protein